MDRAVGIVLSLKKERWDSRSWRLRVFVRQKFGASHSVTPMWTSKKWMCLNEPVDYSDWKG
jgi:hypothetical protein